MSLRLSLVVQGGIDRGSSVVQAGIPDTRGDRRMNHLLRLSRLATG